MTMCEIKKEKERKGKKGKRKKDTHPYKCESV